MKLTTTETRRLLKGDIRPITRKDKPDCEAGEVITLLQLDARDDRVAPVPLFTITITSVVRKAKGGWTVRFDVFDRRESPEFMAKQHGQVHPLQYVENEHRAIESTEAVSAGVLEEQVKAGRLRWQAGQAALIAEVRGAMAPALAGIAANPSANRKHAKHVEQIEHHLTQLEKLIAAA